jgi:hypothetical protein
MAGELGFEPRSSVLETDSLTVELTPPTPNRPLLGLFVVRVLAAGVAELRKLQTTRRGLLVLGRRVVAVLANRALQGYDLAHDESSLVWPATSAGKQLISQSTFRPFDTPRRRVEVPATFIPEIVLREGRPVRHTIFLIHYPRNPAQTEARAQIEAQLPQSTNCDTCKSVTITAFLLKDTTKL